MPHIREFTQSFGLTEGRIIAGFLLKCRGGERDN